MPAITADQLAALEPYIAGAQPDERGEVEIYCPMHADTRRSASLNVDKGLWYCHAGCGGGSVRQLVLNDGAWVGTDGRLPGSVAVLPPAPSRQTLASIGREDVYRWHRRLLREPRELRWLRRHKGINEETVRKAMLGYDGRHLRIPVFSPNGKVWNVRHYNPHPLPGRSKIWNERGMGKGRLYPIQLLDKLQTGDRVLLVEGEWDALLALQLRVPATTHTDGAGKPWRDEWTSHFVGLRVYLCHDRDRAGGESDAIAADALKEVAKVYQCHLPFKYREQHGKDLSDYLLRRTLRTHKMMRQALMTLLAEATPL